MLHADVISFFVLRKFKKHEKLMKIVNIDGENLNEIFRKDVNYDNIKSH